MTTKIIIPIGTKIALYAEDTTFIGSTETTKECIYTLDEVDNVHKFYEVRDGIGPDGTDNSSITKDKVWTYYYCIHFPEPVIHKESSQKISWYLVEKQNVIYHGS